jgi:hypothetical protein
VPTTSEPAEAPSAARCKASLSLTCRTFLRHTYSDVFRLTADDSGASAVPICNADCPSKLRFSGIPFFHTCQPPVSFQQVFSEKKNWSRSVMHGHRNSCFCAHGFSSSCQTRCTFNRLLAQLSTFLKSGLPVNLDLSLDLSCVQGFVFHWLADGQLLTASPAGQLSVPSGSVFDEAEV